MLKHCFELYLDESGTFAEDAANIRQAPSLVGGLLCRSGVLNDQRIDKLVPDSLHACVEYKKEEFFNLLQQLKSIGSEFIIFSNEERLQIVDSDITYLNIISEGIVRLFQELRYRYPDEEINLKVIIAKRQNVTAKMSGYSTVIQSDDYMTRLEEKLLISVGRAKLSNLEYSIEFGDARYSKRLMCADVICNTYLTRNGRSKFSDADRIVIGQLFEEAYVCSVFENATIGYLKKLLSDGRLGEAIGQISALPKLDPAVQMIRDSILVRMEQLSAREKELHFTNVSLQLSRYNLDHSFATGIQFGENYKAHILQPAKERKGLSSIVDYWMFDTDFYILTMYQHMGNTMKCTEYIHRCYANIHAINRSWEHIDYYFRFKIREINCLLTSYEFDKVIDRTNELCSILEDAKNLFDIIGEYEETLGDIRSELLGKVYGLRLQAYINLLPQHPEIYPNALEASDKALAEFTVVSDIKRQKQMRCQLMVTAKQPINALECLLQAVGLDAADEKCYDQYLDKAYERRAKPDEYSLLHYTNVMMLMAESDKAMFATMSNTLLKHKCFTNDLSDESKASYPWMVVLWNISKCYRVKGICKASEKYRKRAFSIATANKDNTAMMLYGVSFLAEAAGCTKEMNQSAIIHKLRKLIDIIRATGTNKQIDSMLSKCLISDTGHLDINTLAQCYLK